MAKTNLEVSNDLMGLAKVLLAPKDSPLDIVDCVVFRKNNSTFASSPTKKVISINCDKRDGYVYSFSDFASHQSYAPNGDLIGSVFPAKLEPGVLADVFRLFIRPVYDNHRSLLFEKVIPSWIAPNTEFYLEELLLKSSWEVKHAGHLGGVVYNSKVSAFSCSLGNMDGTGVLVWNHHPKSVVLANQAEVSEYCNKHDIKSWLNG